MQNFRQNAKWYFLAILFLTNLLIWNGIFAESRDGILMVAFLDVGQGDATFIESSNGTQVLIDAGADSKILEQLSEVMPFYDKTIDVIIATHPDKDHIGGLPLVFDRFDISYFIEPGVESETSISKELEKRLQTEGAEELLARRGMEIQLGSGVVLHILFPDRDVTNLESNTASIIAKLVYGDTSFLLTGDSPKSIEEYVLRLSPTSVDVDVLKIGHHGSKTSTGELFLNTVSPSFAIISSGKDNRYGHPHKEVLDLLNVLALEPLRTDEEGMIVFRSDGVKIIHKK